MSDNLRLFLKANGYDDTDDMGDTIAEIIGEQNGYNPNADYSRVFNEQEDR